MSRRARGGGGGGASSGAVDALLSSDGPLDEDEQARVIAEFEAMHVSQARALRLSLGGGAALACAFYLWAALEQSERPWEQRYTGELRTVVTARGTVAALLVQALSLALAAAGLLIGVPPPAQKLGRKSKRRRGGGGGGGVDDGIGDAPPRAAQQQQHLHRGACAAPRLVSWLLLAGAAAGAVAGAAYWLAALRANRLKHGAAVVGAQYNLLWLPLAPPAVVAACAYMLRSVAATGREVEALRRLTYAYKKV